MERAKHPRLNERQIQVLIAGSECFNQGLYYEAHEEWEIQWRKLPLPDQPQVQAAILVCGFFLLIGKRRLDPALRLASLAIERFAEAATQAQLTGFVPLMDMPETEDCLLRMMARIQLGETDPALLLLEAKGLKAVINTEPGGAS